MICRGHTGGKGCCDRRDHSEASAKSKEEERLNELAGQIETGACLIG